MSARLGFAAEREWTVGKLGDVRIQCHANTLSQETRYLFPLEILRYDTVAHRATSQSQTFALDQVDHFGQINDIGAVVDAIDPNFCECLFDVGCCRGLIYVAMHRGEEAFF
jgi:hypothetical protein